MRSTSQRFTWLALVALAVSVSATTFSFARAAENTATTMSSVGAEGGASQIYFSPVALGPSPVAYNPTYVSPTIAENTSTTTATTTALNPSDLNPVMAPAAVASTGLGVGGWLAVGAVVFLIAGAGWLAWRASVEPY